MSFGTSCEAVDESARRKRKGAQGGQRRERPSQGSFERIVGLCSVRDRSCAELRERLTKDGYTAADADEAIRRAVDCGLVDDARFADGFVRGRVSAGKGIVVIENDLAKHGIDPSALDGWPEGYGLDEESQVERAVELLSAHPPCAKDLWAAAFRKLVSRGYPQVVASRAARLWAESL